MQRKDTEMFGKKEVQKERQRRTIDIEWKGSKKRKIFWHNQKKKKSPQTRSYILSRKTISLTVEYINFYSTEKSLKSNSKHS